MLTSQRKRHILNVLSREGQVVAKALSAKLDLSLDTIRRDLRELASEGLLLRVHGGALPASPAVVNFAGRERLAPDAKRAIGRAAALLVQRDQVVILDGGTTTLQLVRHLPADLRFTVVTHSPTIAVALVDCAQVEVVLIGGRLFKHSVVAVGAAAMDSIRGIRADVYFMGVTGVHPEVGLTTGDYEEAMIKRAFCKAAADTVVLASSDKLGAASPYVIAPITEASSIITDRGVTDAVVSSYATRGVSVSRL
ncbi:MAG: DeoR/GlpR family DNA-binding transcription regulator [bacterium]